MFVVEDCAFLWIVDFEYFEVFHHFCRFDFISFFCEYGRDYDLKVASYRYKGMVVIVHIYLTEMTALLEGVLIALQYIKLLLVYVLVLFEGLVDEFSIAKIASCRVVVERVRGWKV